MNAVKVKKLFERYYNRAPDFIAKAPGRVNLIGEHTDYNNGFVFPIAINKATYCALAFRDDGKIMLRSDQKERLIDCGAQKLRKTYSWADYPIGVLDAFVKRGVELRGMDLFFCSDIPPGAGLSSSASIEAVTAWLINAAYTLSLPPIELVRIAHAAETEFVGVNCGIMDQFISISGKKDHALLLDCRSLETTHVSLDLGEHILLIIDSRKPRTLAASKYHERRRECEKVVKNLRSYLPGIASLREVELEDFESILEVVQTIPSFLARRARHVISENLRVLAGADTVSRGDFTMFGSLMFESHISLKENYEVSCPELDFLVDLVLTFEGGLGARLTGAGFGGCTINLVKKENAEEIQRRVQRSYQERFGLKPLFYTTQAENGAEIVS